MTFDEVRKTYHGYKQNASEVLKNIKPSKEQSSEKLKKPDDRRENRNSKSKEKAKKKAKIIRIILRTKILQFTKAYKVRVYSLEV